MDSDNLESTKVSVQRLPDHHRDTFTRAIGNVLSSPEAELTFGQIIDGLPISNVAFDVRDGCYCPGHPLRDERMELSPGILERARQLGNDFDATSLKMEAPVSHCATFFTVFTV